MNSIFDRDGFALPLVLGITTMLTVIIVTISATVSRKIALVTEFSDRCRADLAAYSAINETLFTLMTATFTFTGLNLLPDEQKSDPTSLFRSDDSKPGFWNLYGEPIVLESGARVTLRDTAGMLSPMSYNSAMLRRLLEHAGGGELMDVLADWQDKDDLKRLNGAEQWEYRLADQNYGPRNAFIGSVAELLLLKGFDKEIYERIEPDLIYWPAPANYLTMSPGMWKAFIDDEALVDQLLTLRREGRLTPMLFASLTGIQQTEDVPMIPSGRVKVTVEATVAKARSRINAVVSKNEIADQPFTIYQWWRG